MTVLLMTWIASLLGATAFFVAGLVVGRDRQGQLQPEYALERLPSPSDTSQYVLKVQSMESQLVESQRTSTQKTQELQAVASLKERLERSLAESKLAHHTRESKLVGRVENANASATKLRMECEQFRQRVKQLESETTERGAKQGTARVGENEAIVQLSTKLKLAQSKLKLADESTRSQTEKIRNLLSDKTAGLKAQRELRDLQKRGAEQASKLDQAVGALKDVKLALHREQAESQKIRSMCEELTSEQRRADTKFNELRDQLANALSQKEKSDKAVGEVERLRSALERASIDRESLRSAQEKSRHAQSLHEEVRRLEDELEDANRRATLTPGDRTSSEERERELRESRLRIHVLEERATALQEQVKETLTLRSQLADAQARVTRLNAIESELERLRAASFAHDLAMNTPRPTLPPIPGDDQLLVHRLEAQLAQLVDDNGCQVAVITDRQGFAIRGIGTIAEHDELAAVAAEAEALASRSRSLMKFGFVREVALRDENDIVFRCRFFQAEEELLSLTTLGVEAPTRNEVFETNFNGVQALMHEFVAPAIEGRV